MAWRWRKTKQTGPFRTTVTKKGVGTSIGLKWFRIGVSPDKRFFISFGIPGSGFYYIKYF